MSVADIGAQSGKRRRDGQHASVSSRADYSHFPAEVASLAMQLFLRDATRLFDPFAGWGERHAAARSHGKDYVGFDVNPQAIETARTEYGVSNVLANSLTADIPEFDGMLTCPPYWNLERYSPDGIEQHRTFKEFIDRGLTPVFARAYAAASPGSVFCVMVGDWRKDHTYYDLAHKTRCIFERLGAEVIDEVIVSRKTVSKIKIMIPQAVRLGYTVKVHEYLLVYRKPGENWLAIPR